MLVSFCVESRNLLVNRQEVIWHLPQLYSNGLTERYLVPPFSQHFLFMPVKVGHVSSAAAELH